MAMLAGLLVWFDASQTFLPILHMILWMQHQCNNTSNL